MVRGMDDEATSRRPRTVKLALGAALAVGATLVGVGIGGLTGVDRQLEAATPNQGETRVVGDPGDRGDCPADKPRAKDSRKL